MPRPAAVRTPRHPSTGGLTAEQAGELLEQAVMEVKKVVVGQDRMIERILVALLARGHCLLEGVPGVAKSLAVETLATVVGGRSVRLQFTPDLVPSDIVGTRIYRPSQEAFDVELGPVFANLVLADEINRAPAKVQSALLEVMAEGQVSIGGVTHPLPTPFLVLATQNPIESEGVYPLPEAQRDRFLMKVEVHHPTMAEELEIVRRMASDRPTAQEVLTLADLQRLQAAADEVFVHHAVAEYAVRLVMATRDPEAWNVTGARAQLAHGASPRGSLGLVQAARSLALVRGRSYVLPADVTDLAVDVLAHRLVLSYDALADEVTAASIVERVLRRRRRTARRSGAGRRCRMRGAPTALPPPPLAAPARLRRLPYDVSRRLDGLVQGDHLGSLPGPGTEAAEARAYAPGDDVRRIDWAVTARSTTPHVRMTVAERELETTVLVDLSASMSFGTATAEKREVALALAAAFLHLGTRPGDRVGALVVDGHAVRHAAGPRRTRRVHARSSGAAAPAPRRTARAPSTSPPARGRWSPARAAAAWWSWSATCSTRSRLARPLRLLAARHDVARRPGRRPPRARACPRSAS